MVHGTFGELPLNRHSISVAYEKILPYVHRTPVLTSSSMNGIISAMQDDTDHSRSSSALHFELFFKCENFQKTGAFKARGAFLNVMTLEDEYARKGVCTHSSGNHAQALAIAAKTRGIPAYIVMPTISTPSKIAATKGYGAHVYFSGSTSSEREAVLQRVQEATGATFIPPYDYLGTILGQGTVALELEDQIQEMTRGQGLDAIIAPLGGGGLLGGIATAHSTPDGASGQPLVYGAEPSHDGADDGRQGLARNPPKRIEHVKTLTIADGLRTPVGVLNWSIISDKSKVEGVFSVTDEQIKAAMRLLLERLKVWIEPSAAVGLAVVMYNEDFRRECQQRMARESKNVWRLGIVLSSGNTTLDAISGLFGTAQGTDSSRRAEANQDATGEKIAEDVAG